MRYLIVLLLFCFVIACRNNKEEITKMQKPYDGPFLEGYNTETIYSDSAKVKMKVRGKRQLQFQNGNLEYPDGVEIDFFNDQKEKHATLTAKKGFFTKNTNIYTAKGDVIVREIKQNKVLTTEELYYNPLSVERAFYTDKFVIIATPAEIVKGQGFYSNQDFTHSVIERPIGSVRPE